MNRSILIVICDFLVLSAMSLSMGTGNPTGSPGTSTQTTIQVSRDTHLDQMREELQKRADVLADRNRLEAELQKLRQVLAAAKTEVSGKETDLRKTQADLAEARRAAADLRKTQAELNQLQTTLQGKEKDLTIAQTRQQVLNEELTRSRGQIVALSVDLQKSKDQLTKNAEQVTNITGELKVTTGRAREAEIGLSYARGRLNVTEKELAEAKGKIEKSNKIIYTNEVELAEAKERLENMKKLLNNAVTELSKSRTDLTAANQNLSSTQSTLEKTKENLSKTFADYRAAEATLKQAQERLAVAEDQMRSDALSKYSKAAVELSIVLENERLLVNAKVNEKLYLPEIKIDGKTYLASTFRTLTGTTKIHTGYNKIIKLDYNAKLPESNEAPAVALAGPILTLNADNRAALLEVKPQGEPLEAMTFEQLKERGLQGLSLFKVHSFGKETTSLDGRCSLNLGGSDQYLYIRNSVRNRSELAAEEGDFVISRQGKFIGIVVAVHSYDMGTKEEAQCYIFPDKIDQGKVLPLPIQMGEGEGHYDSFVKVLRQLQLKASELNQSYTPQGQ